MCVVVAGALFNFGLLASTVPLWVVDGGSGNVGAGAVTTVMMGATVAGQLCVNRLLRRFDLRQLLAAGAVLMGAPAAVHLFAADLVWVLGATALRGVGFGLAVVAGTALVAELTQVQIRGKALGVYGLAVGGPQLVGLPLGLWIAAQIGFAPVFVVAAAVAVLAAPLTWMMSPGRASPPRARKKPENAPKTSSRAGMNGPFTVMLAVSCGLGGILTFLPLALSSPLAAAVGLPVMSTAMMAGRWITGVISDRWGVGRMLLPSTAAAAAGIAALAVAAETDVVVVAVLGAGVYGLGFGGVQNDSVSVMFRRAGDGGHSRASVVWNIGYDGGTGLGGAVVGLLSVWAGLSGAFAAAALLVALTLPLAWLANRGERDMDVR